MAYFRESNSNLGSVICLGTGTSFDIATLVPNVNYTKLTADNFIVSVEDSVANRIINHKYVGSLSGWSCTTYSAETFSKSYNPETGVFTYSYNYTISIGDIGTIATVNETGKCKVYLITSEIKSV